MVCAQLVRSGHSGWQGSATVAAGAMAKAGAQAAVTRNAQAGALTAALVTAEAGRGKQEV